MFSKQQWLILLGVLGMNVACAQVQEPQSTTHQDQTVQGQEVQMQCPTNIRIGQTVTVQLESNPSTGYRWILVSPSEALQVSETEAVAIYHDGRVGAPGQHRLGAVGAWCAVFVVDALVEQENFDILGAVGK